MQFLNALLLMLLSMNFQSAPSRQVWQNGGSSIRLEKNTLEILHSPDRTVEISAFLFNFIEPESMAVESVDTDALTLRLVFKETDGFHYNFPRELMLRIEHFKDTFHFSARHPAFHHITIKIRDKDEHYFGLIEKLYPYNEKNPDLRGRTVDVDVYGNGAMDYAENYASAYSAFFMSSAGYGSFFDTFARGRYRFAIDGATEIYHQTDALDWYLFFGPGGRRIHEQYFDVIGRPKYVPIWACGPVFWRDQNNGGSAEIVADIEKFTGLKIPLTACWVDRPYSDGAHQWSKMNFSEAFARPEEWIRIINEKYGMQFMTWVAPMTFTDPDFPGLLSGFKNYMDLTDPDAVAEFERRLGEYQYSAGVKGHKMDRADENFPLTALWREPVPESATRNQYVYLYAKVIHDLLSKAHGRDQFNFARAAFHRSQPYLSALWGGDSRSNWLGMAGSQANAMRSSFQGFPVWGNDTGGYLGPGKIDEELYMRWLQWSVWNGLFEIKIDGSGGMGKDRAPWNCSPELQEVFRDVCRLRMEMLPYIYSCVNTSTKNGVVMKPLAYVYPDDENTHSIWDEYIFGDAFLVAPLFQPGGKREIYLPAGTWYDFRDLSKSRSGVQRIRVSLSTNEMPVFVKENSIYVSGDIFRGSSKVWRRGNGGELTVHAFPGRADSKTEFTYVDYTDGDKEKKMTLSSGDKTVHFTSDALLSKSAVAVKCPGRPKELLRNGKAVEFAFDERKGIAEIPLETGKAGNLTLKF